MAIYRGRKEHMRTVGTAGGVVLRQRNGEPEILMVRKSDGLLVFPKGHIESGETIEQAAMREVEEETGLQDLLLFEKLGVVVRSSVEKTGEQVIKEIHLFRISSSSFLHHKSEEAYGWFFCDEALKNMKFLEEKEFLLQFLARSSS